MSEKTLHKAVCNYLRYRYPSAIFNTDLSGATKLTIGQAVFMKSLRSRRGFPDIVVYEPRGDYHGLFIELKRDGEKIYTKDNRPATPHIAEQQECMTDLAERGYYCAFAVGIDAAMRTIDEYMKIK